MVLRRAVWALLATACAASPAAPPAATSSPGPRPSARETTRNDPPIRALAPSPATVSSTEPARSEQGPARAAEAPRFRLPLAPRGETRALVLLYHAFNVGSQPLSVRASDFERQLTWLAQNQVEIVHTSELLDFLEGQGELPAKVAVLSIDDGLRSVYRNAWPILKRHGAKFTLGLPTGMLEEPKGAPVMTWTEVREMTASGLCEVASHGHMHRRLAGLSGPKLAEELELSAEIIRRELGRAPVAYFYPLGAYDNLAAAAVRKAGYRAAFRASGAPIAAGAGSLFWLPRMSVFHGEGADTLAYYYRERFLSRASAREQPAH